MPLHPALRTWLQLFRAPNLFSVPGDPLAGFLLVTWGELRVEVLVAVFASVCFYSAGLLHNDLVDLAEDERDRPQRPLPSGGARPAHVWLAAMLLAVAGLAGLLFLRERLPVAVGLLTIAAVLFYNRFAKRLPILGALTMGACRGLSVLIGAAVGVATREMTLANQLEMLTKSAGGAAFTGFLFIAAVTALARHETQVSVSRGVKLLPTLALLLALPAMLFWAPLPVLPFEVSGRVTGTALLLLALFFSLLISLRLLKSPRVPIPPAIGEFIRLLLVLQAAFCAFSGSFEACLLSILLLTCWPISRAVSERFYAS